MYFSARFRIEGAESASTTIWRCPPPPSCHALQPAHTNLVVLHREVATASECGHAPAPRVQQAVASECQPALHQRSQLLRLVPVRNTLKQSAVGDGAHRSNGSSFGSSCISCTPCSLIFRINHCVCDDDVSHSCSAKLGGSSAGGMGAFARPIAAATTAAAAEPFTATSGHAAAAASSCRRCRRSCTTAPIAAARCMAAVTNIQP